MSVDKHTREYEQAMKREAQKQEAKIKQEAMKAERERKQKEMEAKREAAKLESKRKLEQQKAERERKQEEAEIKKYEMHIESANKRAEYFQNLVDKEEEFQRGRDEDMQKMRDQIKQGRERREAEDASDEISQEMIDHKANHEKERQRILAEMARKDAEWKKQQAQIEANRTAEDKQRKADAEKRKSEPTYSADVQAMIRARLDSGAMDCRRCERPMAPMHGNPGKMICNLCGHIVDAPKKRK